MRKVFADCGLVIHPDRDRVMELHRRTVSSSPASGRVVAVGSPLISLFVLGRRRILSVVEVAMVEEATL